MKASEAREVAESKHVPSDELKRIFETIKNHAENGHFETYYKLENLYCLDKLRQYGYFISQNPRDMYHILISWRNKG